MANLREIKSRISSVKDTRKITSAMYLISSNKLQKARRMLENTQPYFNQLHLLISRMARHLPEGCENKYLDDGYEKSFEEKTCGYLIITDDKGLAGAYNNNVIKMALEHIGKDSQNYKLYIVGEVGINYFRSRGMEFDEAFGYSAQDPSLSRARHIRANLVDHFNNGEIDELYVIYTRMNNTFQSETEFEQILPLKLAKAPQIPGLNAYEHEIFLMDPSPSDILDNVIPNYIGGLIYGALVESFCAVQNSRMTAMENATNNATDMINKLNIEYNRSRQNIITQEITEVVSGAKALKKAREKKMKARQKMQQREGQVQHE